MGKHKAAEMWPVMLTPFTKSLEIDWEGVDALVDWYIAQGADGLFAVCLSSEMYQLTTEERLELAGRVVRRSGGRVPVIASGSFGGSINTQADSIKRMAESGVAAVVVVSSQIAGPEAGDHEWLGNIRAIMSLTDGIPLGLYECPSPYHRLLSPGVVKSIADTGRFRFYKDTSCSQEAIRGKIAAVSGTQLMWRNANSPTLLYSLQQGGAGFAGIGANFLPGHFAWLCKHFADEPEKSAKLQRFLSVADMAVRNKYPTSAKLFLAGLGIAINPVCRDRNQMLSEEEFLILEHLRDASREYL